jgi:hypothetical protein
VCTKVVVKSVKNDPNWTLCPRCRSYHTELLNFERLCDRCCLAMIEGLPQHETIPGIIASMAAQDEKRYLLIERGLL